MSDRTADEQTGSDEGLFPLPISSEQVKLLFYGGLLVYIASHLALATDWSWENKLFPYLVGIPLIALIVLNIVLVKFPSIRDTFTPDSDTESRMAEALSSSTDNARSRAERHKTEAEMVVWTVALPVAVYLFGFAYSLPTYVFLFTLYHTRNLKKAAIGAGLFTAFSYVVFMVLLNLRMYHGVVGLPNILEYVPT